jgi:hypothetical protein
MNSRRHRVFGLLASTVTAATLAAPVGAAGNGNASLGTRASQRSNPTLRNDIAHFGSSRQLSAPGAPIVVRVDGGFDWAAAGIGAAGGLGLVLVAGVATSALRSRRGINTARA